MQANKTQIFYRRTSPVLTLSRSRSAQAIFISQSHLIVLGTHEITAYRCGIMRSDRMRHAWLQIGTIIAAIPGWAAADCFEDAARFTRSICGEIVTRGRSTFITTNGQLTAEGRGLITRMLGSAEGSMRGQVDIKEFENVLQEHLANDRADARACSVQMGRVSLERACSSGYKTCSHPSFGVARWENQEELQGSSGWGSPSNPMAYCGSYINAVVAQRGLGTLPHSATIIAQSEENRRTGVFNSGPVQYLYHCKIRISWNPIYNQRADPICGRE